MKHLLLTTIAAVVLVGCGESQQSAPTPETKPVEPVAEATQPEPPKGKAPDISIREAARTGNIEAVKQHLDAGTDVDDAKDVVGYTPLHAAATKGHKEVAELLIAAGADVNAKTYNGWTPLYSAAQDGRKETAELLITKGADVNAKGNDGKTPLDRVIRNPFKNKNKAEIADLLRKHGGKTEKELNVLFDASRTGNLEAAKQAIADGADVNAKDKYGGRTPLHRTDNKEIAELLIAAGADVNAKDSRRWTPLHGASWWGHKEVAELLIAKGADVNAKNDNGTTPLDRAIRNPLNAISSGNPHIDKNKAETADLLRKHGAKTSEELKAEEK